MMQQTEMCATLLDTAKASTRHDTAPSESSVWDRPDFPPNHHGDAPQSSGVFGYLVGLTLMAGRGRDARLVTRLAGLSTTDHVIDIGCGPGTAVRIAARSGARATGVDPSRPMLHLARLASTLSRSSGETSWLHDGAEHLTLPDESGSICWSLASVHHWPDLTDGINEVRRVLEPGGRFIALERRTRASARPNASHGWTPAQAVRFARLLTSLDFDDVCITDHDLGRRQVVTVEATKPARTAGQR